MENKEEPIGSLVEQIELYVKNNMELYKLQVTGKVAEIFSSLLSKLVVVFMVIIVLFILMMAVSYWVGDLLGKVYLGFLVVAGVTGLITLLLHLLQYPLIKKPVMNSIISKIYKEHDHGTNS